MRMIEYNHSICHLYCYFSVFFFSFGRSLMTSWEAVKSCQAAFPSLFLVLSIISVVLPYVFRRRFMGFPFFCFVLLFLRAGNVVSEC